MPIPVVDGNDSDDWPGPRSAPVPPPVPVPSARHPGMAGERTREVRDTDSFLAEKFRRGAWCDRRRKRERRDTVSFLAEEFRFRLDAWCDRPVTDGPWPYVRVHNMFVHKTGHFVHYQLMHFVAEPVVAPCASSRRPRSAWGCLDRREQG